MPLRFTLGYVLLRLQRVLVNGTGELFSRKALHWLMQSFALADAKLCVDGCKALRLRWAKLVQKSSVLF